MDVTEKSYTICLRVYFYIPMIVEVFSVCVGGMCRSYVHGILLYTHDGRGVLGGAKGGMCCSCVHFYNIICNVPVRECCLFRKIFLSLYCRTVRCAVR